MRFILDMKQVSLQALCKFVRKPTTFAKPGASRTQAAHMRTVRLTQVCSQS